MFNGSRLESLRHLNGLTQQELGKRIGLTQAHISRIERGDLGMSAETATTASAVFGEPLSFFEVGPGAVALGPSAFRRKTSMKAAERDRVDVLYREVSRVFSIVSEESGYHEFDATIGGSSDTPLLAAELVRGALGLQPAQPVRNVARQLERLGVGVVTELDAPRLDGSQGDVSGITMPTAANRRPVAALLSIGRGDVQRLTLAHELGHLVLDNQAPAISCSTRSPQEKAAYMFAAAFLLPPRVVEDRISELSTFQTYLEVKAEYGISVSAIVMHARRLGVISEDRARTLQIQHSSRGWRDSEPVEVASELPLLFQQALNKVYPKSTYARASHELGVSPERLRRWGGGGPAESKQATVTKLVRR